MCCICIFLILSIFELKFNVYELMIDDFTKLDFEAKVLRFYPTACPTEIRQGLSL